MEHYKLVLPEYLNPGGSLFGGYLLKWIDEVSFITANLEFPDHRFVTIALDDVLFKHRITSGEILRFLVKQTRLGNTSVRYNVTVFGEIRDDDKVLFETNITFVNTDEDGQKIPINH
jgi:acyl-CoA hydrolase